MKRVGGGVARKERYLVGLDVGTSKCTAIVGELLEEGGVNIVGMGVAESHGIRRGVVVNLEAAVESIKKAIEEAELMAGVEVDTVHLGHEQFVERLQSYVELAPSLREQVPAIDYVDLRFGEHVFVGPVARAGKPADAPTSDRRKAAPPGF